MKSFELIDKLLPNTDIDIDIRNSMDKNELVKVESPDGFYFDIKEIFYLSNPNRTIIRVERKEK